MFVVMVWIFCSIVCGILADNRNRNIWLWAILGLLFGFFAVVIIAILPNADKDSIYIVQGKRGIYDSQGFPKWPEEK